MVPGPVEDGGPQFRCRSISFPGIGITGFLQDLRHLVVRIVRTRDGIPLYAAGLGPHHVRGRDRIGPERIKRQPAMVKIPVDDHGSRIQICLLAAGRAGGLFRGHIKAELVHAVRFISGSDMSAGQVKTAQHKGPVFPYKNSRRPDSAMYQPVLRTIFHGAAQICSQTDHRPGIRVTVFGD